LRPDVKVSAADLLAVPKGPSPKRACATASRVAIQYTAHWLNGSGCSADVQPDGRCGHGRNFAQPAVAMAAPWCEHRGWHWADQEMDKLRAELGEAAFAAVPYERAKQLVLKLTFDKHYVEFLTLPAYEALA
jgi:malate synthase